MTVPWTTKIPMTLAGVAPRVRRIAMSDCLSVTAMIKVETMLNAATATSQRQDDEHHHPLHPQGPEEVRMLAGPIRHPEASVEAGRHLAGDAPRLVEVVELQAQAAHVLAQAKQAGGVAQMNDRESGVVLGVVDREQPDDGESPQAR